MTNKTISVAQSLSSWAAFSSVVAVTSCGGIVKSEPPQTERAQSRLETATMFALELDGVNAGWIQSVEGGIATADVVSEKIDADFVVKKQIGNLKYEDFTLKLPAPVSPAVAAWISEFVAGHAPRKSGSMAVCDFNRTNCGAVQFYGALITEVGFPAADAASKDAAFMTLKFTPALARSHKLESGVDAVFSQPEPEPFAPSEFIFTVAGLRPLEGAKVSKVDAITIKQTVSRDDVGEARDYALVPGKLEFPNLKVTFAPVTADFVIDGENTAATEKTGSLVYLNRTRQKELLTLSFGGLGIFKISSSDMTNNEDKVANVTAEMYYEEIEAKPFTTCDGDGGCK